MPAAKKSATPAQVRARIARIKAIQNGKNTKAAVKKDYYPLSMITKQKIPRRGNMRIPRWNYYDPVWRGHNPVPVGGVSSSFLTQNIRTTCDVATTNTQGYVIFAFHSNRYRIWLIDAARTMTFIQHTADASLEEVRALCACVRLRNTTEVGKVQGGVSAWIVPEPIHLELDPADATKISLASLQTLEHVLTNNTKTKYFTAAHFYKERKFVCGPADQIRYKTYHKWEPPAFNGYQDLVDALKEPVLENMVFRFDATPMQAQAYKFVLDEQWATRHAAGTTLQNMQATQNEINAANARAQGLQERVDAANRGADALRQVNPMAAAQLNELVHHAMADAVGTI